MVRSAGVRHNPDQAGIADLVGYGSALGLFFGLMSGADMALALAAGAALGLLAGVLIENRKGLR